MVCMDESFQVHPGGEPGAAGQQETPVWPVLVIQLQEGGADPEQQNVIKKHLQGKALTALPPSLPVSQSASITCTCHTLLLFMQH